MERNTIRKIVNDSITRLEFRVDRIKWGKDLVEPIIYIDDVAFDEAMLVLS